MTQDPRTSTTLDPAEIDRFARIASEWWDANGKLRTLHQIGPARMTFLRDALVDHFHVDGGQAGDHGVPSPVAPEARPNSVGEGQGGGDDGTSKVGSPLTPNPSPQGGGESRRTWHEWTRSTKPLAGLAILDIGCGGGLVCEPLARLGASVIGIDPAEESIEAARRHAEGQGLAIDYRVARVEDLAAEGRTFDAISCLEVIEHVPDPAAFLKTCASLVRPGGLMLLSTLNRTIKAYLLAVVGAEYVLRWLPVGTHQWERFVTPDELARYLEAAGLSTPTIRGLVYNPLKDTWSLADDTDVNYFAAAAKAG
ncbi:MAG TPA: bifunctional 2-polyprenyl-6-hydroxyphenol methylase/3-demethylubiquinol 3-O-methyltransferase UbiG [Hyphomicrobiaceae bacterium]|nr:bifunctional 2-polyprenyl-6-hydroxyphenol methylase/3-demethylubiquinol 3-O-methyltransferase UbiG [Hyphomicrobiaceae bacterium]